MYGITGICCAALASVGIAAPTVAGASTTKASKSPITIAWMATLTGPYTTPSVNNDIKLAVNQINAHGGVDGHPVRFKAYDANLTPEQAVTATQQALGSNPTAIIGYSVDSQIQATASLLRKSGIPVLAVAQGPAAGSKPNNVPNLYTVVPNLVTAIQASTAYATKTYHPKSVGIFHTEDTASDDDATVAQALLKKDGVHNFTIRSASDTATDTTEQALAMKGSSVVFEYGFPLVEASFNTALSQNGISTPIMGDQSGNFLAAYGLNKPAELKKYVFTPYCFPAVLPTSQARSYVSAYQAAYPGSNVQEATPYVYDAVNLIAAAVKAAGGSTSHAAITKELGKITFKGACGTYHSDANHDLMHQVALVSFANGFNPGTLAATYIEHPVPASYFKSGS